MNEEEKIFSRPYSGFRNEIYKKQFPTGSWLGVKELALPEFVIEIELEAHQAD